MNRIFQVEPEITNSDIDFVSDYLKSGSWITEHTVTKEFEENISKYVDRKYAIAVPNGTIAIYLALLGSGVKEGMKVGVPNLTMIATINAVIWAKATPVLIDVDESLCMSYEKIREIQDLDAVIYVPLNGRGSNGEEVELWCQENSIKLIEDSAHALGSNYPNKPCGKLGDLSIFSFTPHKIITTGQGGMILTDNKEYKDNLNALKTFNRDGDKSDWHKGFGLNFKFTDLQASLGVSQFKRIEKSINRKNEIYNYYKNNINNDKTNLQEFNSSEVPWFFTLEFKDANTKNKMIESFNNEDIESRNFYPALNKQEYLTSVEATNVNYSENIYDRLLWIPSSVNLSEKALSRITETINKL